MRDIAIALALLLNFGQQARADNSWQIQRIRSLEYPPIPLFAGAEGEVHVEILIAMDGSVREAKVSGDTTGVKRVLGTAAKDHAMTLKFRWVGDLDAMRQESMVITYHFKIPGKCTTICSTQFTFEAPSTIFVVKDGPAFPQP